MSALPINEVPREAADVRYLAAQELHNAQLYIDALCKVGSSVGDAPPALDGHDLASLLEPLSERINMVQDWLDQDLRSTRRHG